MTLSARGQRLLTLLRFHGRLCSFEANTAMKTNYSPRAANELRNWLATHAEVGGLTTLRNKCVTHRGCAIYLFVPPAGSQVVIPLPAMYDTR